MLVLNFWRKLWTEGSLLPFSLKQYFLQGFDILQTNHLQDIETLQNLVVVVVVVAVVDLFYFE